MERVRHYGALCHHGDPPKHHLWLQVPLQMSVQSLFKVQFVHVSSDSCCGRALGVNSQMCVVSVEAMKKT